MSKNIFLDLEDFGEPSVQNKKEDSFDLPLEEKVEEEIPFPEKTYHLTEDELEEVRRRAYENGVKETKEQFEENAKKDYEEIIAKLPETLEEINDNTKNKLEEIIGLFFDFSYEFVEKILELPEDVLKGIKDNILEELLGFIRSSEEKILIKCNTYDKNILETSLDKYNHVTFEICDEYVKGSFKVISQNSVYVLSSEEWKKLALQKILDSVFSLIKQQRGELQKDINAEEGDDK